MFDFEPYLNASKNGKMHRHRIRQLSDAEREKLAWLVQSLDQAGATEPFNWAISEVTEGIAQSARFHALKAFWEVALDVEGNACAAEDFGTDLQTQLADAEKKLGAEALQNLLTGYGLGLMNQLIDVIDYGDCNLEEQQVGWQLMEVSADGTLTGRHIGGLHEDSTEFGTEYAYPEDSEAE